MKENGQVTIYDVAKKAGVSAATVSRVLNSPDLVGGEKKQKILDAIKELHFVPKADAVANARKNYKKIGVIASFFTQPSFMERLRGITNVLAKEHYEVVIYSIETSEDLDDYISSLVTSKRVDGLILLCVQLSEKMLSVIKDSGLPVCFVESQADGFDCVAVNNFNGGEKAAEYLYKIGCRNPAFLGNKPLLNCAVPATEDRLLGFKNFFEKKGVSINEDNIWISRFPDQDMNEGIEFLLKKENAPDAVFCSSDVIATCFIHLAQEIGIEVPAKVKVLGFDDIDIANYTGLSSINQSLDESGKQAAMLVMDRIKNPQKVPVTVQLQLQVKERATTKQ